MSIELGSLGTGLKAVAEPDGWWLRGPALADHLAREGGAAEDPGARRGLLEVAQMLEMGLAECRPDGVIVPWELLGDALTADLTLPLRWTTDSPLMLSIDRTSDLGYPDFTYR
jgi:hypothetical protein